MVRRPGISLVRDSDGGIFMVDAGAAQQTLDAWQKPAANGIPLPLKRVLSAWRKRPARVPNLMEASIACAKARVTTGEWSAALRGVFGEYRPPTGVEGQRMEIVSESVNQVRQKIDNFICRFGYRPEWWWANRGWTDIQTAQK